MTRTDTVATGQTTLLRRLGWGLVATLFLIPLAGRLATSEVGWTLSDFAVWAAMLSFAGLLGEGMLRTFRPGAVLTGGMLAVGAGFLLVWINLAVGFLGNEHNPLNQTYFAMLTAVLIIAAVSRFRLRVMAWLMVGCAVVQATIPVIGRQAWGFEWVATGIFCAIWLVAAALFARATRA